MTAYKKFSSEMKVGGYGCSTIRAALKSCDMAYVPGAGDQKLMQKCVIEFDRHVLDMEASMRGVDEDLWKHRNRLAAFIEYEKRMKPRVARTVPTRIPPRDDVDDGGPDPQREHTVGSVLIAGGTLGALTGFSFMANGAAWSQCRGSLEAPEEVPSARCLGLVGLAEGTDLVGFMASPNLEAGETDAGRKSTRAWVTGSVVLAGSVSLVVWGAVKVWRARQDPNFSTRRKKKKKGSIAIKYGRPRFEPYVVIQ